MKRLIAKLVVLFLVLSLSVGLVFAEDKIVLKFSGQSNIDHPENKAMLVMADLVSLRTNGRIEIQIFPNGQLGNDIETVEDVIMGNLDLIINQFYDFFPPLSIAQMPYIWKSMDHVISFYESPLGQEIKQNVLDKLGVRILGVSKYGWRYTTTSNIAIETIEDMKGLKLRIPGDRGHKAWAEATGLKATPMSFSELYLALKQGVVDGQDNPLPTIDANKFSEVQKYLIETKHILAHNYLYMNEKSFQKLSKDDQEIILESAGVVVAYINALVNEAERNLVKKLEDEGMTLIIPKIEPMMEACAKIMGKYIENEEERKIYEEIISLGENF